MKKVLFVLALGAFAACGSGETSTESADTTTVVAPDTTTVITPDTTTVMAPDTTVKPADTLQK